MLSTESLHAAMSVRRKRELGKRIPLATPGSAQRLAGACEVTAWWTGTGLSFESQAAIYFQASEWKSLAREHFCTGVHQVRRLQKTVSAYWKWPQPLAERKQVTSLTLSSTFFRAAVGCRCFVILLAAGENPAEIYICFVAKLNLASF